LQVVLISLDPVQPRGHDGVRLEEAEVRVRAFCKAHEDDLRNRAAGRAVDCAAILTGHTVPVVDQVQSTV